MLRDMPVGEDTVTKPKGFAPGPTRMRHAATSNYQDIDDDLVDKYEDGFGDDKGGEDFEEQDDVPFDPKPTDLEFLQMVYEADQQSLQYINQVNRKSWERGYRAFHQEHFNGSKYDTTDYNNRSRLFVPKTRNAVRKDMAATSASLFGSIDAVNCMAGNEGDQQQRASAALLKELVNYRTDRATGKASIPWFHVALGARQTSLITGICMSKQYWKLELRRSGTEDAEDEETGESVKRDVWVPHVDRPECELFPPENFVIDPAADWTNPAQDAAYIILKYPMRIDEIRRKQRDPRQPWHELPEGVLRSSAESQMQSEAVRRSREQGLDRFDTTQNTRHFDVIWVWETYMRTAGEDWTFISIGNKALLTDPKPVRDVYPEQFGERPLALGYGSLEAFRIFPMSSVESWQMLQQESNDIRNLSLDALKQNIMPVTKVKRGRNVDLEQLKRRGQGTSIMVMDKDDVTWEQAPSFPQQAVEMTQKLDIEFDDLAGQQNYGTVQDNNNLGKTLGGLKLAAGAANAVQEYDIRVWIETWCEPVLSQIVRLEQFYESDPIILGICGDKAKLLQKHGISEISDELLENSVTVRVNVGLGAGDPQQRLAKFQSAVQVAMPLLQLSPDFAQQKVVMDYEAVMEEVFGAAGYRDGGKRFIKLGQGQQTSPLMQADAADKQASAELKKAQAKKAILDALSNAAKVGVMLQDMELQKAVAMFGLHLQHVDQMGRAIDMGYQHGHNLSDRRNAAQGLAPDGTPMLPAPGESPAGEDAPGSAGGEPSGASPGVAAGGAASPPQLPDAEGGVDPASLSNHQVPAGDAGQQQMADEAKTEHAVEQKTKPKKRKVSITKRGKDGRASEFAIEDQE
jgi:hypothetical protein